MNRAAAIVAFACLTGCAEGDLGRIRSSIVTDDIHAWIGTEAAGSVGIAPSYYPLTDDERELRDLAYPLIEAPFDRQRWYSVLGEYGLNGYRNRPFDVTAYSHALMARPARSGSSRYALLVEDIRNDIVRIGPFFRTAARVADMDKKRTQSLAYVTHLSEAEHADTLSRIAENQLAIIWVEESLRQRSDAYRYALEHLVIAYPSPAAVEAEQMLNRLRVEIDGMPVVVAVQRRPRAVVSK